MKMIESDEINKTAMVLNGFTQPLQDMMVTLMEHIDHIKSCWWFDDALPMVNALLRVYDAFDDAKKKTKYVLENRLEKDDES
jgi:hypothetical protein